MTTMLSGYQTVSGASHMSSVIFAPILRGVIFYFHYIDKKTER